MTKSTEHTLDTIMSWHGSEHVDHGHALVNRADMSFGSGEMAFMADGSIQTIGLRLTRAKVPADRPRRQDSLKIRGRAMAVSPANSDMLCTRRTVGMQSKSGYLKRGG